MFPSFTESPEEDAGVRTRSKTSNQEERSGPSLEDGDDDVATDIFHKLSKISSVTDKFQICFVWKH